MVEAFTHGDRPAIPADIWLPMLVERARDAKEGDRERWRVMLHTLLWRVNSPSVKARPLLLELAADRQLDVVDQAISSLLSSAQPLADVAVASFVRGSLLSDKPNLNILQELSFRYLDESPEQLALLFHADPQVQLAARGVLYRVLNRNESPKVVEPLLAVLDDPQRAADHVAAIRALAALHEVLSRKEREEEKIRVTARLKQVLREGDRELLAPAIYAIAALGNSLTSDGRFVDSSPENAPDRIIRQATERGVADDPELTPERRAHLATAAIKSADERLLVVPPETRGGN